MSEDGPKERTPDVADDNGVSSKEAFIAGLSDKTADDVESVVPQTTLNRSDRSMPGAFRVLTTQQAQAAANDAADAASDDSSSEADDSLAVLDATIVATAVKENTNADDPEQRDVAEVFKAIPLDVKPQRFPRFVLLVVVGAFAVSSVSLGLAFSMRKQSSTMEANDEQEKVAPLKPHELFEPYNKITSHLAFVSAKMPNSCTFNVDPVKVQVSCGDNDTDSVLKVYREFSLNTGKCEYDDNHRTATCALEKGRPDLTYAYVVYSCGFHSIDGASSSVVLVEQSAICSPSSTNEFDVFSDKYAAIHTAIALGGLCWNFGELEYRSVQTQCDEKESSFLIERRDTDACIDVWMEDECTGPSGCMIGSYGIVDSEPVCDALDWASSVFGPESVESATEHVDLIAQSNRGFADLFDEEFGN